MPLKSNMKGLKEQPHQENNKHIVMQIILNEQEELQVLEALLCDGLHYFNGYGINLKYSESEYAKAREQWTQEHQGKAPCVEDVQIEMLKMGYGLDFMDTQSGEFTRTLTLESFRANIQEASPHILLVILDGDYDITHVDTVLQTVLYGKPIFA